MKKRTAKRLASFLSAAVMLIASVTSVFATGTSVEFKGFADGFNFVAGSEYTRTDLFDNFKNVMPGDVLTEEVMFTNSAEDCDFVNLFMRTRMHDETENPFSLINRAYVGETEATANDFLSKLSMKVWNGTELIYDTSPDMSGVSLRDNRFLGTLRSGETLLLTVELTIPRTLGNEYANRIGEVDWIFHVEAWNEDCMTVRKLWSDSNSAHADESITVNLLRDGLVERSEVLNEENQWMFTFEGLTEGSSWSVEEADVPEGYTVSYETVGNTVTIINTGTEPPPPGETTDLSVKKLWDSEKKKHPDFATVTLYNGLTAVETVKLSDQNDWSYKWSELPADGNWQVVETNIPDGYTPTYSVKDGVVTITNTAVLIKTGQLNWPIPVLSGLGLLLISLGIITIFRKKKRHV